MLPADSTERGVYLWRHAGKHHTKHKHQHHLRHALTTSMHCAFDGARLFPSAKCTPTHKCHRKYCVAIVC
jgi:hypothetical protein